MINFRLMVPDNNNFVNGIMSRYGVYKDNYLGYLSLVFKQDPFLLRAGSPKTQISNYYYNTTNIYSYSFLVQRFTHGEVLQLNTVPSLTALLLNKRYETLSIQNCIANQWNIKVHTGNGFPAENCTIKQSQRGKCYQCLNRTYRTWVCHNSKTRGNKTNVYKGESLWNQKNREVLKSRTNKDISMEQVLCKMPYSGSGVWKVSRAAVKRLEIGRFMSERLRSVTLPFYKVLFKIHDTAWMENCSHNIKHYMTWPEKHKSMVSHGNRRVLDGSSQIFKVLRNQRTSNSSINRIQISKRVTQNETGFLWPLAGDKKTIRDCCKGEIKYTHRPFAVIRNTIRCLLSKCENKVFSLNDSLKYFNHENTVFSLNNSVKHFNHENKVLSLNDRLKYFNHGNTVFSLNGSVKYFNHENKVFSLNNRLKYFNHENKVFSLKNGLKYFNHENKVFALKNGLKYFNHENNAFSLNKSFKYFNPHTIWIENSRTIRYYRKLLKSYNISAGECIRHYFANCADGGKMIAVTPDMYSTLAETLHERHYGKIKTYYSRHGDALTGFKNINHQGVWQLRKCFPGHYDTDGRRHALLQENDPEHFRKNIVYSKCANVFNTAGRNNLKTFLWIMHKVQGSSFGFMFNETKMNVLEKLYSWGIPVIKNDWHRYSKRLTVIHNALNQAESVRHFKSSESLFKTLYKLYSPKEQYTGIEKRTPVFKTGMVQREGTGPLKSFYNYILLKGRNVFRFIEQVSDGNILFHIYSRPISRDIAQHIENIVQQNFKKLYISYGSTEKLYTDVNENVMLLKMRMQQKKHVNMLRIRQFKNVFKNGVEFSFEEQASNKSIPPNIHQRTVLCLLHKGTGSTCKSDFITYGSRICFNEKHFLSNIPVVIRRKYKKGAAGAENILNVKHPIPELKIITYRKTHRTFFEEKNSNQIFFTEDLINKAVMEYRKQTAQKNKANEEKSIINKNEDTFNTYSEKISFSNSQINELVDEIYWKLEKKIRFERQRCGL